MACLNAIVSRFDSRSARIRLAAHVRSCVPVVQRLSCGFSGGSPVRQRDVFRDVPGNAPGGRSGPLHEVLRHRPRSSPGRIENTS